MATIKQIHANRVNALKSTGPRTAGGKLKSRLNAVRHGLTAVTVVSALESAADYESFEQSIAADYNPTTATEQELVARLASVLWRLRRSTRIETGLIQVQAELMKGRQQIDSGRNSRPPEWYDEFDVAAHGSQSPTVQTAIDHALDAGLVSSQAFAYCFVQVSRLQFGAFDTLSRYETALWRQAGQLLFLLDTRSRR